MPFFLPALALILFGIAARPVTGQEIFYPGIQRLDTRDAVFSQFLSDVESSRRLLFITANGRYSSQNPLDVLTIYSYTPGEGESILTLSARCNVPYSSIATLNRIANAADMQAGKPLLLPSMPGLFIPENPENELECLMQSSRSEEGYRLTINNGSAKVVCRFYPGEDFKSTERIFYLNRGFYFPLRNFRITSAYGLRQNPVTGSSKVHQGLDLAAPEGTPVYASREGVVSEQGEDPVLGKYIIVTHDSGWISLYGHLSVIGTVLRQQVNSASLIGRVGSTGQSTGPHLHFELRQNGRPQDPERLLRLFQTNQ